MMPEQARYRTKLTQSGIFLVQYRTKIRHAGMPMPALVSSMPMPSYAPGTPRAERYQGREMRGWERDEKRGIGGDGRWEREEEKKERREGRGDMYM
jgi:hypothetical protein